MDKTTLQRTLLLAALPHVADHGWTLDALSQAEKDAKLEDGAATIAFPRGAIDLIDAFALYIDENMLEGLNKSPFATMGMTERVKTSVLMRLEALGPYRSIEQSAIGFLSSPTHLHRGTRILWRTADTIWITAGDTATDYNRNTKRLLLSSVLAKTTLYWLGDESDGYTDTHAFLERQLALVLKTGKTLDHFKKPIESVKPFLAPLKSFIQHAKKSRP